MKDFQVSDSVISELWRLVLNVILWYIIRNLDSFISTYPYSGEKSQIGFQQSV